MEAYTFDRPVRYHLDYQTLRGQKLKHSRARRYLMTTLAVNRSSWCSVPSGFWPVLFELSDQAG